MVLFGCAASVTTEQYVGEYEKQKSLDEVEITKVDGLKIVEVKFNKDVEERYPEFKLYKMITRSVNNHTPEKQLDRVMFDKYRVSKKKLNKKTKIINIDKFPVCT